MKASPGGEDLTVPRLVVLNTIFAGSTFSLRAAEAVIGRTEDNDITIEHKSVSRNHAKIVREGDRVRILDLKSANGVLVNNEEVEQAVLRSGDVVELGRVKLRFVPIAERFSVSADEIERARIADAAGDDFESDAGTGVTNPVRKKEKAAFSAPSASYPVVEQGRSPWVYVGIGGAVVALLAVIAVIVLGRGDEKKSGEITPPPAPPPVVATNPPPPTPTPPTPTPPPPVEEKAAPVDDAAKAADPPVTPPVEEKAAPDESHKSASSSSSHSSSSKPKIPLSEALKQAKADLIMKDASSAIELLSPFDNSKDADVHRLLGVAYAQKHMTQAAARHYREYLKLKPDAPDAEQVRKILDGVK